MPWTQTGNIKGPPGAAGPTAVSADANNAAVLGSDSLIWVDGTQVGLPGDRGSLWYTGTGAPVSPMTPPEQANDLYLDVATGEVYSFA
jgi:hypothetical protein